jgi:tRNA(Arg) A34 adenosine deaminase TadA
VTAADHLAALPPPMRRAVELAWEAHRLGNIGVGAVVTDPDGVVVAHGRNRTVDTDAPAGRLRNTSLAHAEIDVLGQLPAGDYGAHTLWTTLQPCLLCTSAAVLSHMGTVVYLAADHLWRGTEQLPDLNHQTARRWPRFEGPAGGPLATFTALLPLLSFLAMRPGTIVEQIHAQHTPGILDLGQRLVGSAELRGLQRLDVDAAIEALWSDLVVATAPTAPAGDD